jgi:hypothetical protein
VNTLCQRNQAPVPIIPAIVIPTVLTRSEASTKTKVLVTVTNVCLVLALISKCILNMNYRRTTLGPCALLSEPHLLSAHGFA